MDQAEGLRTLMENPRRQGDPFPRIAQVSKDPVFFRWPRVISVSSGKGGVGKTNIVANLGFAFTQLQQKVLVLDADLGLANMDVLLGLIPKFNIEHLLNGQKTISDILIKGPGGMSIMPASSGVQELAELNESQKRFLLNELDPLAETIDILLIDTSAGISSNVLYFNMAAEESIIITTPEPTSITDAYALIKVLSKKCQKKYFTLLVNSAHSEQEALEVFKKISKAACHFLGSLSIDYLGFIPFDEKLPCAVTHQRPVLEIYPLALSSRSFMKTAQALLEKPWRKEPTGNVQFFWKQLFKGQLLAWKNGGAD
jgi:flagellar biosynthesis protein FlhG